MVPLVQQCCWSIAHRTAWRQPLIVVVPLFCLLLCFCACRVGNKQLISIIWALALLPDPAKAITSKAATEARARAVAGFGAAVLTRMNKLLAEELFHVLAGLALLGFKPPRTLQRDVPEQDALTPKALAAQPVDAVTAEMRSPPGPVKFATLLERRSIKVMPYVNAKGFADAGFVVSRLVPAGDMSQEWLKAYAMVSTQSSELGNQQQQAPAVLCPRSLAEVGHGWLVLLAAVTFDTSSWHGLSLLFGCPSPAVAVGP